MSLEEVSHCLSTFAHGSSSPTLDLAARVWRVAVLLAYPIIGPVGQTNEILVSATSEEIVSYTPLDEMKTAARSLYEVIAMPSKPPFYGQETLIPVSRLVCAWS